MAGRTAHHYDDRGRAGWGLNQDADGWIHWRGFQQTARREKGPLPYGFNTWGVHALIESGRTDNKSRFQYAAEFREVGKPTGSGTPAKAKGGQIGKPIGSTDFGHGSH